jgi:hypothetical protein
MIATETRWKCKSCWHISVTAQLLRGKNPFNEADIISGCPKCKGVEGFYEVCDEPGCTTASRTGWKSGAGYRRTCDAHSAAFRKGKG